MKVTIKDVAKEANVAASTVSRVLSNSSKISQETKIRVNEAIKKLNYTPNIIARGLAKNKTRILAVILQDEAEDIFSNPFFVQAMKGISISAQKENYYIMYAFNDKKTDEREWISKFIDSNLVDGVCLLNSKEDDKCIEYLREINCPFVVIGRPEYLDDVMWVDNDNFQAAYNLVNVLFEKGHTKIGFVGAKGNLNVSKDRLSGYKEALKTKGINIDEEIIFMGSEFSQKYGQDGAQKLFENKDLTAIIASDDLLAFGVQTIANQEKRDISVVGFNNTTLAKYQNPPLASVDINVEELGYYATKLIIDKLENRDLEQMYYVIETKLIKRESLK